MLLNRSKPYMGDAECQRARNYVLAFPPYCRQVYTSSMKAVLKARVQIPKPSAQSQIR